MSNWIFCLQENLSTGDFGPWIQWAGENGTGESGTGECGFLLLDLGGKLIISAPKYWGYPWPKGRRGNKKNVKVVIKLIFDVEKDAVQIKLIACT